MQEFAQRRRCSAARSCDCGTPPACARGPARSSPPRSFINPRRPSAAVVVADATLPDCPLIYASEG